MYTIKDYFSKAQPQDLTILARLPRRDLVLVRGSSPLGEEQLIRRNRFGIYQAYPDGLPSADGGIVLYSTELQQLAQILNRLIADGEIRDTLTEYEFSAFVKQRAEMLAKQRMR